jgi:hypothetical protein
VSSSMPSASARATGAARDESSLRQMLAGVVPDDAQRGVGPRGDLASGETGRVASQHCKLGRAGLHDEVAVSSVRSRDAAVLLASGPRSRVSRPGVGRLRGSHPPSDRASPGNGSRPARARKRIASRSRRFVPESLRMASSVALGDPFHVTLDVRLESVQPGQLEGAAGQEGGQRASEEASGSEGGVQVGRR